MKWFKIIKQRKENYFAFLISFLLYGALLYIFLPLVPFDIPHPTNFATLLLTIVWYTFTWGIFLTMIALIVNIFRLLFED
jgi:hypothetical protein